MFRSEAIQLLTVLADEMERAANEKGRSRPMLGVSTADVLDSYAKKHGFDVPQTTLAGGDGPKARTTDPQTSKDAAIDNAGRRGTQKRKILDAVIAAGPRGLTASEAFEKTGIPLNTVSTRFSDLRKGGFVAESQGGERLTPNGSKATVYVATSKGEAVL